MRTHQPKRKADGFIDPRVTKVRPNIDLIDARDIHTRAASSVRYMVDCAFCHSWRMTADTGEMVHYVNEKQIEEERASGPGVVHVHQSCLEWAPKVYFDGETAVNLNAEIARASKLKCSYCGLKGAALGCFVESCNKSFHTPCVFRMPGCRWDEDNKNMLCPSHKFRKLLCDTITSSDKTRISVVASSVSSAAEMAEDQESERANSTTEQDKDDRKSVSSSLTTRILCEHLLSSEEKDLVYSFARQIGAVATTTWEESVTHIIASTNEHDAFARTAEVLMGILTGKWILKTDWVKDSLKAGEPLNEEPYEITHDVHGYFNGPQKGRTNALEKTSKLFSGRRFFLSGEFRPNYKFHIEKLISIGGGVLLEKGDLLNKHNSCSGEILAQTFIVYNCDPPENRDIKELPEIIKQRSMEAISLAVATGAQVIDFRQFCYANRSVDARRSWFYLGHGFLAADSLTVNEVPW